jgi:hypothetical protein
VNRWLTVATALGFLAWSAVFQHRATFLAVDRNRYASLFDDALISMRYAWNLAHGNGLVWNPGERVEGYSNFLTTLLMAIPSVFFDARRAVLAVQLFGIATVLGVGLLCVRLARSVRRSERCSGSMGHDAIVLAAAISFYPLSFWSVTGMETGLLTLLFLGALVAVDRWVEHQSRGGLFLAASLAGLLTWVRPDAVVFALLIPAFAAFAESSSRRGPNIRVGLALVAVVMIFPLAQLLFRVSYYGHPFPNTYVLKIEGFPILDRIRNGIGYFGHQAAGVLALLSAVAVGVWNGRSRIRLVAGASLLVAVLFQTWAGGDAWPYWRMVAPALPLILALAASDLWGTRRKPVALAALVSLWLLLNVAFLPEIRFQRRPYQWESNVQNVNTALALRAVTEPSAMVGVFWAGAIPFYSERPALDFLGKSDPVIARRAPDLSGAISWSGMRSVPGHNKYDLDYSIRRLRPTYVQGLVWGRDDLTEWGRSAYDSVLVWDVGLRLRHGDPRVHWERTRAVR